jgi:hypothetical protein
MKDLKLDSSKILSCVDASFEGEDPLFNDSKILREQRE